MEEEWGRGGAPRLSKSGVVDGGGSSSSNKKEAEAAGGEVDYKTKSGTAWSHNYLNQKPWHPLSYPNQRRKWIAEQTHAQRERRAQEIAREFAQEQEFFRQTALVSKKEEKEKMEIMKAVSFMYVRPPGYNAESAKAAEIADEMKKLDQITSTSQQSTAPASMPEVGLSKDHSHEDHKKDRPTDVFGRALPSEEDFEVLKNAPRLETGVPVRIKPFAVEIRNVRCVRCGTYGHQSGDRECPLKDAIMPNDESRLKREDPLRAMTAHHADSTEPIKWELKQRPGMSPPHGGFRPDDPNQQIVPEDIFDEYGGFLGGEGIIPSALLLTTNISAKSEKKKRRRKHKQHSSASDRKIKSSHFDETSSPSNTDDDDDDNNDDTRKLKSKHVKRKRPHHQDPGTPEDHYTERHDTDTEMEPRGNSKSNKHVRRKGQCNQESNHYPARRKHCSERSSMPSSDSDSSRRHRKRKSKNKHMRNKTGRRYHYHSSGSDPDSGKEEDGSRRKTKRRSYRSHSSSSSSDDHWDPRSAKRRKHHLN